MIFARLLPAILKRASVVKTAEPTVLYRIGKRIGIAASSVTPTAILNAIKANKLTAALVLYELFGIGDDMLQSLMDEDPQIKSAIEAITKGINHVKTSVEKKTMEDIAENVDELETISKAVGVVGSLERLLTLRQALELDEEHYALYRQVRALGTRLR